MRLSKRAFSLASRFSRASAVSGRRCGGSIPGHVYFIRLVLTNVTCSPSCLNRVASALISPSVSVKYSLRLSTVCRSRISTCVSAYWCANAMASSTVFPISSVIALIRALSHRVRPHSGAAHAAPAAASNSRLVMPALYPLFLLRPRHPNLDAVTHVPPLPPLREPREDHKTHARATPQLSVLLRAASLRLRVKALVYTDTTSNNTWMSLPFRR